MTGTIGKQLETLTTMTNGGSPSSAETREAPSGDQQLVVLPAGFVGDLFSKFAGTIGEVAGGAFGEAALGRKIGDAASGLGKFIPFTVVPPSTAGDGRGGDQPMVVVPAGFVGGLLGGIGGKLLGGQIGEWLGNKEAGKSAGSALGGVLGGLLPFQVLPPAISPASVGPAGSGEKEPMIVVPAGFFGNLLKGVASTIAYNAGDSTVRTIASSAAKLSDLVPFHDVPPERIAPQGVGPDGGQGSTERLVVLPAGFFGNLLSGLAETVGGAIGDALGDEQTGRDVGAAAKPLLELIPFHTIPQDLMPQSNGSGGDGQPEMMMVPAGLFGGLLSSFAGAIGGVVGEIAGNRKTGEAVGKAVSPILELLPFSVLPRPATSGS